MTHEEKTKILTKAVNDFEYFVFNVFSKSFDRFIGGEHIIWTSKFLENKKTMRISARDHFKSTSLYAHFMWNLCRNSHRHTETHYFSFQQSMAGYHIGKIKALIARNPFFEDLIDHKSTAENVIKYSWDNEHFHTIEPHGLLAFKRGIHCDCVYVDDPLQDPANKMVTTIITKVNNVIKTQLLDMPRIDGECHIVGTPQTTIDFFFDKNLREIFKYAELPAEKDHSNKIALWPEYMDWDELMGRRKTRGQRIYNQEFLCSPVYTEEGFFKREQVYSRVNKDLKNNSCYTLRETDNEVIAGFDIGKKAHPSHLAVFEKVKNKRVCIAQVFMDGWDYIKQVEFLQMAIDNLGIDQLYYDATRGEFESFLEQDLLPSEMIPVNFNLKTKGAMSAEFDKAVTNNEIEFINDKRFLEQILLVDNELKAIETPDGHGDSFWSTALSFYDKIEGEPNITVF